MVYPKSRIWRLDVCALSILADCELKPFVVAPTYAEDPKNPYAARIAKEKAIAHH